MDDRKEVLVIVGDSDVARWPSNLLPDGSTFDAVLIEGTSGATLEEVLPLLKSQMDSIESPADRTQVYVVVCAGENDIGVSIFLDDTLKAFHKLLDMVGSQNHLIFLGPKFEPYMQDDALTRKQYSKMSRAMERACRKYTESLPESVASAAGDKIFLDCLTMFCGDSGELPGATVRAKPLEEFFDSDMLHLSDHGYRLWKDCVDREIERIRRQRNEEEYDDENAQTESEDIGETTSAVEIIPIDDD